MQYDAFINKWLGKAIDWDGLYGAQCVDMVAQYCTDNGKPVAYANAKDWANHPALQGAFNWTTNNPADPNQLPNRGDIVVFSGNQPGSGGYGHIDIFDMKVNTNVWQGLDQNWNGAYVHFVPNHVWTYVLGWWTAKPTPAPEPPPPPPPAPVPAPDPHPDPAPVIPPVPPIVPTEPHPEPVPDPTPTPEPTPPVPPTEPPVDLKALILAIIGAITAAVVALLAWLHN
jgi:hypothetical protein